MILSSRTLGEYLFLVVNAARKQEDIKHIQSYLPDDLSLLHLSNQALLALQGPKAAEVLAQMLPEISQMSLT